MSNFDKQMATANRFVDEYRTTLERLALAERMEIARRRMEKYRSVYAALAHSPEKEQQL